MRRVLTIGEALIDFIPEKKGVALKDVGSFMKAPGGAPANVAAGVARLGGTSGFIGMLGEDAFGDFLQSTLADYGVITDYILRTKDANTGLAFVSLDDQGERDFSFYRNPSADMLLKDSDVKESWFKEGDILHFCSVDLIDAPVRGAHIKAISTVHKNNGIISFDPNVRLPLWDDTRECREAILSFLPLSDVVKVSEDELLFITGTEEKAAGIDFLFQGQVSHVIYTKGDKGAEWWTRKGLLAEDAGKAVKALDTTGAGDAFVSAILFKIATCKDGLEKIDENKALDFLGFANTAAARTVTKPGAMGALPTMEEIKK